MQLEKANPKMGFWRAKQGLSKTWDLKAKLVSNLGESLKQMGEGEEKRKRKKKKRRRGGGDQAKRYGNYFEYGFCMDHMEF